MHTTASSFRIGIAALAITTLSACAGTYTGPVEVVRFVAENPAGLGEGTITTSISDGTDSELRLAAYENAVARELRQVGYTVNSGSVLRQEISIALERSAIDRVGNRSPVNVGVGGRTGSFGSGVGVGVGINLGGGRGPRIVTEMSARITDAESGETLWEGRAELVTSTNSPFADTERNAQALAAALFRDFPGGNGETVQVSVDDLERTP